MSKNDKALFVVVSMFEPLCMNINITYIVWMYNWNNLEIALKVPSTNLSAIRT